MVIDKQLIEKSFGQYWNTAKNQLHYIYAGKPMQIERVSSCNIMLNQCEEHDECCFRCQALNLRVQSDGVERTYKGEFYLEIGIDTSNSLPHEFIKGIKDNIIYLKN